jgi:hypothetical protein
VSRAGGGPHDTDEAPPWPDAGCRRDRRRGALVRDPVGCGVACVPARARRALVPARRHARLRTVVDLPLVVPLRCLCPGRLRRGRRDRSSGRPAGLRCRGDGFDLARTPAAQRHDLWIGALGEPARHPRRQLGGRCRRVPRPRRFALSPPRRSRARHGLCPHALGQGRRPRRADPARLDGLDGRPRHQGRELAADRRLALALLALPALQPDRRPLGALQPFARGAARRRRSARRPEHRRHPGRSRGCARTAQPLGEDQPFAAGRRDPPYPLRRGGEDARPGRDLPVRSRAPVRRHAARDDDDQSSRHGGDAAGASGRRVRRARGAQQVRQRALGRAVDRDVFPRPLPRPYRRSGHRSVRLAGRGPCFGTAPGFALLGRPALGHQSHQAADPPGIQPDRPAPDRAVCTSPACPGGTSFS